MRPLATGLCYANKSLIMRTKQLSMAATVGGDMVVRVCKARIPWSSHVYFGAEIGIAFLYVIYQA